jgi:hypothetical protein
MTSTARVTLRYRPAADVLTGQVHFGDVGNVGDAGDDELITESPDADTTLVWAGDRLSSFQVVFASARSGDEAALPLPAALLPAIQSLLITALHALDDIDDQAVRLRAKAEATTELPLEALCRGRPPELTPRQLALDRRGAARLAHSLSLLADAVHTRVPLDDDVEALHTDHLARLLRELSATIQHHRGRTAPGTTAATRVAARAGEAFNDSELRVLEQALTALDDQRSWPHARESLDQLLVALQRSQSRG